jgi:hypothetical protein
MIFLFRNEFDIVLNTLLWLTLATFTPWLFFSIYGPRADAFRIERKSKNA